MELTDQEKDLLRLMINAFDGLSYGKPVVKYSSDVAGNIPFTQYDPNIDKAISRSLLYKLQVEIDGPPSYDEPRITNLDGPGIGNDLVTSFKRNK